MQTSEWRSGHSNQGALRSTQGWSKLYACISFVGSYSIHSHRPTFARDGPTTKAAAAAGGAAGSVRSRGLGRAYWVTAGLTSVWILPIEVAGPHGASGEHICDRTTYPPGNSPWPAGLRVRWKAVNDACYVVDWALCHGSPSPVAAESALRSRAPRSDAWRARGRRQHH